MGLLHSVEWNQWFRVAPTKRKGQRNVLAKFAYADNIKYARHKHCSPRLIARQAMPNHRIKAIPNTNITHEQVKLML